MVTASIFWDVKAGVRQRQVRRGRLPQAALVLAGSSSIILDSKKGQFGRQPDIYIILPFKLASISESNSRFSSSYVLPVQIYIYFDSQSVLSVQEGWARKSMPASSWKCCRTLRETWGYLEYIYNTSLPPFEKINQLHYVLFLSILARIHYAIRGAEDNNGVPLLHSVSDPLEVSETTSTILIIIIIIIIK